MHREHEVSPPFQAISRSGKPVCEETTEIFTEQQQQQNVLGFNGKGRGKLALQPKTRQLLSLAFAFAPKAELL